MRMSYNTVFNKGIVLLLMMGVAMTLRADTNTKWLIVYSKDLPASAVQQVAMAIVEPELVKPAQYPGAHTRFYAYISLGAVNVSRSYWPRIRDKAFVVEQDDEWPDSYRMDLRSPEWQGMILNELIPEIINQGFSGIFLDTIDVPYRLEAKSLKKFKGSHEALVALILEIRKKFPKLGILPNNAMPILPQIGKVIDGVVVEDLYTRYNFVDKTYGVTPLEDTRPMEAALDAFLKKDKKPVYVVLYGDPNSQLIRDSIAKCKAKGYHWYVTTVDLTKVGEFEK